MSLVKTLAKVAIGIAVAKGIGSMMQGGKTQTQTTRRTGSGGMFGGERSPQRGGGLEDMMGDILGGGSSRGTSGGASGSGGLGGLFDDLDRERRGGAAQPGGLDDLLGGLTKGGGSGGLGEILGGVLGGATSHARGATESGRIATQGEGQINPKSDASFGQVLNQAFGKKGEPQAMPTPSQDAAAGLMLRAMIQAAKADGKIDAAEKDKLLKHLDDATEDEMAFVKAELNAPVDVHKLASQIPQGLEPQVYAMSVLAINLDHQDEAQYLHALAEGIGLDRQMVNHIHDKMGLPPLYS